jgi:anhydro-N-acetylmuramic acid kinase
LPEISKEIGYKVICNFRNQDIKYGGQGAPLVPVGEKYLFSEYDSCINLGGFSNISKTIDGKLIAYDICPVNTVLNFLSKKMNLDFDKDGEISKNGKLIKDLYAKLNKLDYYNNNYPKSLGIEWVNSNIIPLLEKYPNQIVDLLHTYSCHIAEQVSKNTINETNVLVTGGGAKNKFLIDLINNKLNNKVIIPDIKLIDYKESIIFGFLGVLKMLNINNCYSSVTGSSINHCSGDIFLP